MASDAICQGGADVAATAHIVVTPAAQDACQDDGASRKAGAPADALLQRTRVGNMLHHCVAV